MRQLIQHNLPRTTMVKHRGKMIKRVFTDAVSPLIIGGWTGVLNCGVVTFNGIPVTHNGEVVTNGTV